MKLRVFLLFVASLVMILLSLLAVAGYQYQKTQNVINRLSLQKYLINQLVFNFERHAFDTKYLALSYMISPNYKLLTQYKRQQHLFYDYKKQVLTTINETTRRESTEKIRALTLNYINQFDTLFSQLATIEKTLFTDTSILLAASTKDKHANLLKTYQDSLSEIRAVTDKYVETADIENLNLQITQQGKESVLEYFILAILALILCVFIFFNQFLNYYFISPIVRLSKAQEKISESKSHPVVKCNSPIEEIQFIVNSYNKMVIKIVKHVDELEHLLCISEELQHKAESGDKAKVQFVANISHELRTPLNSIVGYCELLSQTSLNQEQNELLKPIMSASKNLLMLINELLNFAKMQAGTIELEEHEASLEETLSDVLNTTIPLINKAVNYNIHVADDVPLYLTLDHFKLYQVLVNLIGNAIKFTEKGEIKLLINIDVKNNIEQLCFMLIDTGIGMDHQQLEHIFEPFYKTERKANRKYGGTGLGLTISHEIIKAMGGEFKIESKLCMGTTCYITLPLQKNNSPLFSELTLERNIAIYLCLSPSSQAEALNKPFYRISNNTHILDLADLEALTTKTDEPAIKKVLIIDSPLASTIQPNQNEILKNQFSLIICIEKLGIDNGKINMFYDSLFRWPILFSQLIRHINQFERVTNQRLLTIEPPDSPTLQGLSVLLAEDIVINQLFVVRAIENAGAQIESATNGKGVLSLLEQKHYDVVLMDLHMPIMDGFETTRIIRQHKKYNEIKIIALSADAQKTIVNKCTEIGMDGFITKPFKTKDLVRLIADLSTDGISLLEDIN